MTIRDSNYITILAPMITRLKLKGNELLVFALIHGFSQDGETRFKGSISYLINWTGLDKSTVISILKKLVERDLLVKFEFEDNRVKRVEYGSNYYDALGWLENPTTPRAENPTGGSGKIQPGVVVKSNPILIDNNIDSNISNPETTFSGSLFPENAVKVTEKKTLFRNSVYSDFGIFEKKFTGAAFEKVDMFHYFNSVSDWSDSANKTRTAAGWLATVRTFIRKDNEKGKVKFKPEFKEAKFSVADAMDFLNNDY